MLTFEPFALTFKLVCITTVALFVVGLPLAYWLTYYRWWGKVVVEALVGLPLVLPPSVLGFYLLLAFSPENSPGSFLEKVFDVRLAFTFEGLVVASMLYSLPFMVQPLQAGFKMVSTDLLEASYSLGKNRLTTLTRVILPNMKTSLVTAGILTFAHTVGEFGVVLMVGGNIPGETRVASVAIYDEVQAMNYHHANIYSVILLAFSFVVLVTVYTINQRGLNFFTRT
jgi:molybdate transport system permease protein